MKFICIGRNYAAHIAELQHAVPEHPVFFLKQENATTRCNRPFFLPDFSNQVDYETEIIVKINRLWENGELNDERIESFRNLHERTPYN